MSGIVHFVLKVVGIVGIAVFAGPDTGAALAAINHVDDLPVYRFLSIIIDTHFTGEFVHAAHPLADVHRPRVAVSVKLVLYNA